MPAVTALSFKCPTCGAPLVPDGTATVRCAYCGAVSQVAMQQPSPVAAPPPVAPPPAFVPLGDVVAPAPRKVGRLIGCAVILPIVLTAGAGAIALIGSKGGFGALGGSAPYTGAMGGAPCVADANGDGEADPIGFISEGGGGFDLAAFDGKTGKRLWTSEASSSASAWCAGSAAVIVASSTSFDVARLDPRTGRKLWAATLHDKVNDVSAGDACVSFDLADGSSTALDTASGHPVAKCATKVSAKGSTSERAESILTVTPGGEHPKVEIEGPNLTFGTKDQELRGIDIGDEKIVFGAASGTPRVVLAAWPKSSFPPLVAADGSRPPFWELVPKVPPKWTQMVDVERSGSGQYDVAVLGDRVFVAGKRPGDSHGIAYALVDGAGSVVYTKWIESSDDNIVFWTMSSASGRAYIHWEWSLSAVDMASGKVLWTTGTSSVKSTSP